MYAIWYGGNEAVLGLPYIVGGQAVEQWKNVEPQEGRYDFSSLHEILGRLHERGLHATVQINGNLKPDWMFAKVPFHRAQLGKQVKNDKGTLMYWHPAHRRAYHNLLVALAKFLEASPHRDSVLGVRLNFNALGTEHYAVPREQRSLDQWTTPDGVAAGEEWSPAIGDEYRTQVLGDYVGLFPGGGTRVFVRNNIRGPMRERFLDRFENGDLCWFHTSTEAQPRSQGVETQYQTFIDYCRSGKTLGYAECWADAWGYHGQKDDRWCSPPQWNYWRLLADLHCGVSFIAVYGNDLGVALAGRHPREEAGRYQDEFNSAFEFASRYAGYHASPEVSPGAWAAFREGEFLQGDYNFLMRRLPDGTGELKNVGPEDQRFGAWARRLPRREKMRLVLDDAFARSLSRGKAELRVLYFDGAAGGFRVASAGRAVTESLGGSGQWRQVSLALDRPSFARNGDGAHIVIESGDADLILHMVEVVREP